MIDDSWVAAGVMTDYSDKRQEITRNDHSIISMHPRRGNFANHNVDDPCRLRRQKKSSRPAGKFRDRFRHPSAGIGVAEDSEKSFDIAQAIFRSTSQRKY